MDKRRLIVSIVLLGASLGGCSAARSVAAPAQPAPAADAVEALIKRQSQAFSDASASGDVAALARYLDDRVVFMTESGEVGNKKDLLEGVTPPPPGVSNALTQTDWGFQLHGSVAVTSFTDVSTQVFHGQTLRAKFKSTEVWLESEGVWRMISSQTMAVQEDPPAVTLAPRVLDEYVGTYSAGSDFTYQISRDGDQLTGAVGKGHATPIKAELVDVLFTPGQPRARKIFQRDASGKVTGFVIRRDGGHDITLKRDG
jgi:ketosteroid isomerase-like protein